MFGIKIMISWTSATLFKAPTVSSLPDSKAPVCCTEEKKGEGSWKVGRVEEWEREVDNITRS